MLLLGEHLHRVCVYYVSKIYDLGIRIRIRTNHHPAYCYYYFNLYYSFIGDNGTLVGVDQYQTLKIPAMVHRERMWDSEVCMCFLDKCLTFLKHNVKAGEIYILERKAGSSKLVLRQTPEVGQPQCIFASCIVLHEI